jgi:subtilisin family serine protease
MRLFFICLYCLVGAVAQAGELRLRSGVVDTADLPRGPDEVAAEAAATHLLVQFDPARDRAVRAALQQAGVAIEAYVPDSTWRVRRAGVSAATLRTIPGVVWVGAWRSQWKIEPNLRAVLDRRPPAEAAIVVYGHVDGDATALQGLVAKLWPAARLLDTPRVGRLPRLAFVPGGNIEDALAQMAAQPDVAWIDAHGAPETHNSDSAGVIQSGSIANRSIWTRGLTGSGQIVALADTGLDANERWFTRYDPGTGLQAFITPAQATNPPQVGVIAANAKVIGNWVQPGATAYETLAPCGPVAAVQHGTHVAGTLAGDSGMTATPTSANADPGDGMAPNAQILMQDIGADCLVIDDFPATLKQAHAAGARIHNNSWGALNGGVYSGYDFDADDTAWLLEDLLIVASAGNRSDEFNAIGSPGMGKNVLTVGALEHGENTDPAPFTSIGHDNPKPDKPDIAAPGVAIVSAAGDDVSTTGEDAAQSKALSGTSMASPTVAGGAALMRQYFEEGFHPRGRKRAGDRLRPLAATMKAALMNSTLELVNTFIGLTQLPSLSTGWGRMFLERDLYFPGDARRMRVFERTHATGLATGEVHEYALAHIGAGESLRVTLAWMDAAGVLGAEFPLVNDLDLELVAPNGDVYYGNALRDPGCLALSCYRPTPPDPCVLPACDPTLRLESIANLDERDRIHSVEAIRILAPQTGAYLLRVRGHAVPGNDRIGSDRQGYGLVVAAAFATPASTPIAAPMNLSLLQNDLAGIRIGFDAVAGADTYQLYRADGECAAADLADFHLAGVSSGTLIDDTHTIGGDRYAYRIRAVDADAEGAASACIEVVSNAACTLPPPLDLAAPVAMAGFDTCRVELDWTPTPPRCALASGVSYEVERAGTPDLVGATRTPVAAPPFVDAAVAALAPYYYRVRAIDAFGNASPWSAVRNVTPTGAGGPAGLGFVDDVDHRSHADLEAPWQIVAGIAIQGQYAYRNSAVDSAYAKNTCAAITLPDLIVPDAATLRYEARFMLESGWDGVVVELSDDDGATWTDLAPAGGYPGSFAQTMDPPINACGYPASQGAFNGDSGGDQVYTSDLSAWAGQRVRIRWRFSSDPGLEFEGFQLDAVTIAAPNDDVPADLIQRAGFENGDGALTGYSCTPQP